MIAAGRMAVARTRDGRRSWPRWRPRSYSTPCGAGKINRACGAGTATRPDIDPAVVTKSAGIIKSFIEDYHEKLEEDHIFPRFEQAGKLVELTVNLRAQHAMGRRVTERIVAAAKSGDTETLRTSLGAFNRMYRPHEAREDTVLFPALHKIVSKHEYDAMGEEFERIERKTFGGDGFDMAVDQVTELEKQFGVYDIGQFTPTLPPAK